MAQEIQIGTTLLSEYPKVLGLESDPYYGDWRMLRESETGGLDRKIRAAGWNFFFIASEIKVKFYGGLSASKIKNAVERILGKVDHDHFNGVEITGITTKHFLGMPYAVVSAHSRHIQQNCYLDSKSARQSNHRGAAWAQD